MTVTPPEFANVLDAPTLAEISRVRESGVLGATGRLVELFDFLASRSADNRPPKEAEIALAVFGKADSEALRDDPVARVYIHRLRKKLAPSVVGIRTIRGLGYLLEEPAAAPDAD